MENHTLRHITALPYDAAACMMQYLQLALTRVGKCGSVVFIHSVASLATGPQSPPKRVLHIIQSTATRFQIF